MLRRIELEVLAIVERGDTISECDEARLQRKLSLSCRDGPRRKRPALHGTGRPSEASRPLECPGRRNLLGPRSAALPHHFSELLTGKTLEVLYYLDQPRIVTDLAALTDNYRNTLIECSNGSVTAVSSGLPTVNTNLILISAYSTRSRVNSHTVFTVDELNLLPRTGRFSGKTTTSFLHRPKQRSTPRFPRNRTRSIRCL